ncbi:MAG TPA: metal-dependent hydrolase [Kofleriaceae bacterium]|nr:metal-dependent hydrolase [Kofleriaceae bacterium]
MSIPIPRALDVDLTKVPRHWLAGNAAATAISNGINLLFPHGERFFVRSVNAYFDQIKDPTLRSHVKAFFKQEGHHAKAHDDFNAVLRAQGFEIDTFLGRYRAVSTWLEKRVPAKLNLAGTAAAEHFTAILAEGAFKRGILDSLHPLMQQLLAWHAAEEIEHKAVAFDVLTEVDDSYALRMAGLAYATIMLASFWAWGTAMLLRQEKLGLRGTLRELRKMRKDDPIIQRVFIKGIRQYMRRAFHPNDNANEGLAAEWFAARGLPFPVPEAA